MCAAILCLALLSNNAAVSIHRIKKSSSETTASCKSHDPRICGRQLAKVLSDKETSLKSIVGFMAPAISPDLSFTTRLTSSEQLLPATC